MTTYIIALIAILFTYRAWFLAPEIIGGDWPYYFPEHVAAMVFPSPAWVFWRNNGFGGVDPVRGLHTFESFLAVLGTQWLGLPWPVVYKVGWFGLFLLLSFVSSSILWKSVVTGTHSHWPAAFAGFLYTTNTYILMVAGGGQMGVALAYSLAPAVFASFSRLLDFGHSSSRHFRLICLAGLVLGFQVMVDPRIAYVTMIAVGLYSVVGKKSPLRLFPSLSIAAALNAFWIAPLAAARYHPLGTAGGALVSAESLSFFSVADFPHALSLLHPNWPENIFGKTYFLQPEVLAIPILAYSALLRAELHPLRFFAFLGLVGAFLAKGSGEPFGAVYAWLFAHAPGFAFFRDPTKFYLLIALSYSVLIPFTVYQWTRLRFGLLAVCAVLLLWFVSIRQALLGQLGGTFSRRTVPAEYVALKEFLLAQPAFSRTLWAPRLSRFGFSSALHPAVEAQELFGATSSAHLAALLADQKAPSLLRDSSIRYVIVPTDPMGEIFVRDRRYDHDAREALVRALDDVWWLEKVPLSSGFFLSNDLRVYALR